MAIMTDLTGQDVAAAIRERSDLSSHVSALEVQAGQLRADLDAERSKVQPVSLGGTGATSAATACDALGIEHLGKPTNVIGAGSDLNDYTVAGCWRGWSWGDCLNAPDVAGGTIARLIVRNIGEDDVITQELTATMPFNGIGYTWVRRRTKMSSGAAWTEWACVSGVDAIVAEGTSGGWTWVKWANGTAMCWVQLNEPTMTQFAQYGNLYAATTTVAFPLTFTAEPIVVPASGGRYGVLASLGTVSNSQAAIQIVKGSSASSSFWIKVFVVGKWK